MTSTSGERSLVDAAPPGGPRPGRRGRRVTGFVTAMWGRDGTLTAAAVGTVAINLGGTALRFVIQVALARWLGATTYGRFVVGRGWGELLAKVPNRGYQMTVVRQLPRYEAGGEWGLFRGMLWLSRAETLALGLVLSVLAIATYLAVADDVDGAIVVGFLLGPALAMVTMSRSLLQGVHRYVPATALTEIVQPLLFAAAVGLLVALDEVSAPTAVGLYALTMVAIAALEGLLLHRSLPTPARATAREYDRPLWVGTARPMFVAQLAIAVLGLADVLIVGAVVGPRDAGLYAVATRIAVMGRVVNSGLEQVVAPRIAAAWAQRDSGAVQHVVDQTIRTAILPTLGFVVVASIAATPLLQIFGDEYVDARVVLWILLAGNVGNALTGPSGYVISLTDSERLYAVVMGAHAVALVVLAFGAADLWGITAVAVVQTLVTWSWNGALVAIARRAPGVRCYPRAGVLRRAARTG